MNGILLLSYGVLWLMVLFLAFILALVLREVGFLHEQVSFFPIQRTKLRRGEPLPDVRLVNLQGNSVSISELLAPPKPVLIVSAGCGDCGATLKELANGRFGESALQNTIIVSIANLSATEQLLNNAGIPRTAMVLVDANGLLRRRWGIRSTPTTIHVDGHLTVLQQDLGFFDSRPGQPLASQDHEHFHHGDHLHNPTLLSEGETRHGR